MSENIFRTSRITNQQTINANRFTLRFEGLQDLINAAKISPFPGVKKRYEKVKNALGGDPATSLELSLVSINVPSIGLEVQNIPRFNDFVKAVQKFQETEEMTVTFMDYVNGSASAIINLWFSMVADKETGAIGFKQDFVLKNAYFMVYGPNAPAFDVGDGEGEVAEIPYLQKYRIVNLFPSRIELGEHSAENAEGRRITVPFQLDNIIVEDIKGYDYSAAPMDRYSDAPQGL